MRARISPVGALLILIFLTGFATGQAQNVLYVEYDGKPQVVRAAREGRPLVEINGKLVPAISTQFLLKKTEEYAPFFVSVRDANARSSHLVNLQSGAELNFTFRFAADFESPYHLPNVFVVLELGASEKNKSLFIWEVGELKPHRVVPFNVSVRTDDRSGPGKYKVHVFSDGREVFHSKMPFTVVETALDKMIARRVQRAPDGPPAPYVGPIPEYPPKLVKVRSQGAAVIQMRIAENGRVLDPTVKSASDPEFGESALAAIRQWRFMPKIENGHPVEMKAEMPFNFSPPESK